MTPSTGNLRHQANQAPIHPCRGCRSSAFDVSPDDSLLLSPQRSIFTRFRGKLAGRVFLAGGGEGGREGRRG